MLEGLAGAGRLARVRISGEARGKVEGRLPCLGWSFRWRMSLTVNVFKRIWCRERSPPPRGREANVQGSLEGNQPSSPCTMQESGRDGRREKETASLDQCHLLYRGQDSQKERRCGCLCPSHTIRSCRGWGQ